MSTQSKSVGARCLQPRAHTMKGTDMKQTGVTIVRHGDIASGRWMMHTDLVADVQTLLRKQVCAKYGLSHATVTHMRNQLESGTRHVVKSDGFRTALASCNFKEVAAMFKVSNGTISLARRQLNITRPYIHHRDNAEFINDLVALTPKVVAYKYGLKVANVYYHRSKFRGKVTRIYKSKRII